MNSAQGFRPAARYAVLAVLLILIAACSGSDTAQRADTTGVSLLAEERRQKRESGDRPVVVLGRYRRLQKDFDGHETPRFGLDAGSWRGRGAGPVALSRLTAAAAELRGLPFALLTEREQIAVNQIGMRGGEAMRQARIVDLDGPVDQPC